MHLLKDAFSFKIWVKIYFSHLIKDGIVERTGMECGYNEDPWNMEKSLFTRVFVHRKTLDMKGKLLRWFAVGKLFEMHSMKLLSFIKYYESSNVPLLLLFKKTTTKKQTLCLNNWPDGKIHSEVSYFYYLVITCMLTYGNHSNKKYEVLPQCHFRTTDRQLWCYHFSFILILKIY